jgi:hypothetical protein
MMVACAAPAAAQEPPAPSTSRPLIIIASMQSCCPEEAWVEAERRAKTELEALGLEVLILEGKAMGEQERRAELEAMARQRRAACALRIVRPPRGKGGGIELWVSDRITHKMVFRHLGGGDVSAESASITALRTVEVLRASLIELKLVGRRPPAVKVPEVIAKVADESIEKRGHLLGLRLGFAGSWSRGGTGGRGGPGLAINWSPRPHLGLEIDGQLSFLGEPVDDEGSSALFYFAALRAWALWEIVDSGLLRPACGIGGGILIPWSRGDRSTVYDGVTDTTIAAYLGATTSLALALSKLLWLRVGARAGVSLPEVTVSFAQQTVVRFGQPLLEGFADLELRVP